MVVLVGVATCIELRLCCSERKSGQFRSVAAVRVGVIILLGGAAKEIRASCSPRSSSSGERLDPVAGSAATSSPTPFSLLRV